MKNNYIEKASFSNLKVIKKEKEYKLNEQPFGVLTNDENDPLFSVSVSNSSLSIDIWSGCSYGCKYCHVQGIYHYIKDNNGMRKCPIRDGKYDIYEIITSLLNHPFFEKNETIISIATGSTEPFGSAKVSKSTIEIINELVKRKCYNPIWIVTKAGIPEQHIQDLVNIAKKGIKIMISICWAGNPKEIEPIQNNRFKNIEKLKNNDNIFIAWYMRPLVKEWGANKSNLIKMFEYVNDNYKDCIDFIVPGGLRWTSGIEYALTEINNIKLPNLIKNDNKKTLDNNIIKLINKLSYKYFPNIPVFYNSSCTLSNMLQKSNISLSNNRKNNGCKFSRCPYIQTQRCNKCMIINDFNEIEEELNGMGINIKFKMIDLNKNIIKSIPELNSFNYTIKQVIIKKIAKYQNKLSQEKCHELVE